MSFLVLYFAGDAGTWHVFENTCAKSLRAMVYRLIRDLHDRVDRSHHWKIRCHTGEAWEDLVDIDIDGDSFRITFLGGEPDQELIQDANSRWKHMREMKKDGWTHFAGGCWVASPR